MSVTNYRQHLNVFSFNFISKHNRLSFCLSFTSFIKLWKKHLVFAQPSPHPHHVTMARTLPSSHFPSLCPLYQSRRIIIGEQWFWKELNSTWESKFFPNRLLCSGFLIIWVKICLFLVWVYDIVWMGSLDQFRCHSFF